MTTVTARVHLVHLMNADWAPGGRQPSDQANRLGLWVCRKMAATTHIHHRHWLLLLSPKADTHFPIPQRVEGWVNLGTAGRVHSPCPRLYIAVAVVINITGRCLPPPLLNHCDLLRHVGANNLPKVVTRQRHSRELNSQPCNHKATGFTHQCLHRAESSQYIQSAESGSQEVYQSADS